MILYGMDARIVSAENVREVPVATGTPVVATEEEREVPGNTLGKYYLPNMHNYEF